MMTIRKPNALVAGPDIAPMWYCLLVLSQKERATREHLRAAGIYAFYPSREKRWTVKGKTYRAERPEVTGYVFAQFKQAPQWHVLKETRRLIVGVLGRDGVPLEIDRDVIRHLQGLTVEAQRLEEAKRAIFRVRAGDRAQFAEGPLAGFVVNVDSIAGGEAVLSGLLGFKGRADLKALRRIIPDAEKGSFNLDGVEA